MRAAISALIGLCLATPSAAMANACEDAWWEYNRRLDNIDQQVQRYTRCLRNSEGREDCSSHFRRLRTEQQQLEQAVQNIRLYCN